MTLSKVQAQVNWKLLNWLIGPADFYWLIILDRQPIIETSSKKASRRGEIGVGGENMRKFHLRKHQKDRKISQSDSHDFKDMVNAAQQSTHDFRRLQNKFSKLVINYKKKHQ